MSINEKKLAEVVWAGGDNLGGTQLEVYWAAWDWFDENGIKDPPKNIGATDLEDLATISENHVFKTGYGFMKLGITAKTGNIESTTSGEADGKVKNNILTFLMPGSDAKMFGFERLALNRKGILLVKEVCGQTRQIGTSCVPGMLETSTGSLGGGAYDGKKGLLFEFHDFAGYSAAIYTGTIQLATESSAS